MPDLHRHGYEIADLVLSDGACERIAEELPQVEPGRGGVRDLGGHSTVLAMMERMRFPGLSMIKATLFDKTPESNWRVQWHQDRVIRKGAQRIEPPAEVLQEMVAVRVHLDPCGPENGPLRVIPGSHRRGILTADEIAKLARAGPIAELTLPQGAVLFIKPLLVHASSPAITPGHRRVLHVELGPHDWAERRRPGG